MDAAAERRFRDFVAARSPALMRLAFLLSGGDQHAAEDLLQIALAKTVARWHAVDEPEAYVRRVLYRQQISLWRRATRRREIAVAEPPEGVAQDATQAIHMKIVVRHALARLTPRQRAVLVLRYFEDLPEAEVAAVLGCSVGTVRSTAHRSLAKLRVLVPELAEPYTMLGEAMA
ncbi:SigE family RNA polymerase sigma factor [Rhizohabitans arisaemae]|uniref:SigE family RNA polymerase sigma factor n=1 Tax=Rhizohabitans arisaemae TaxID=2720610 RepID=UPI0024B1FCCD|nr:SigE family RNA polymerase sigma factor [Rhizohabitans arisaemae]